MRWAIQSPCRSLPARRPTSVRPSLCLIEVEPKALLADKAYDANTLIDALEQRGITPVIPPKANRIEPRDTDFVLYRERNLSSKNSSTKSNTIEPSPRATTSSPTHFSPPSSWFA